MSIAKQDGLPDLPLFSGTTLPQPLPTPRQFQRNPDLIWHRYDDIVVLRQSSQFTGNDSPLASLYRLCEFVCANEPNQIMLETKYFWSRGSWNLHGISDPRDKNTERYAVLASLLENLVYAFNYRLDLGSRREAILEPYKLARVVHLGLRECLRYAAGFVCGLKRIRFERRGVRKLDRN